MISLRLLVGEAIANPPRQFKAIHLGHHAIENRQRKGLSRSARRRSDHCQRRLAAVGHLRHQIARWSNLFENPPIGWIVVDHQHRQCAPTRTDVSVGSSATEGAGANAAVK